MVTVIIHRNGSEVRVAFDGPTLAESYAKQYARKYGILNVGMEIA